MLLKPEVNSTMTTPMTKLASSSPLWLGAGVALLEAGVVEDAAEDAAEEGADAEVEVSPLKWEKPPVLPTNQRCGGHLEKGSLSL